jgi:hypothetical protein
MNRKIIPTISLLCAFGLSACAQRANPQPASYPAPPLREVIRTAAVEVVYATQVAVERPPAATEAPAMPYPAQAFSTALPESMGGGQPEFSTGNQMVMKDAQVELLVPDTDLAIEHVTQLASDQGGYILSSRSWYDGEIKRAEIKLSVPSAAFEDSLNYLRNLAERVLSETATGVDVSAQYTDLKSRLDNLEATAARVRGFLDDAHTVEDALRINQVLSDLEGQIEQIKGQMNYYEGRVAFSTIYVLLTPDVPTPTPTATLTPTPAPLWSPGDSLGSAASTLVRIWQTIVDGLIWVVVVGGPFILILLLAWFIGRRIRRKPSKINQSDKTQSEHI